jgi:nitrite reductase/ring-hydroxylating ferredoxin subunit
VSRVDVGSIDEFPDRAFKVVEANGWQVGICRWGSELFALRNLCPHQGAPVCLGFLQQRLRAGWAEDGVELETAPAEPVILCAWHRWEFSVRTGESVWDPRFRVKTYPVTVEDRRVLVQVGRE